VCSNGESENNHKSANGLQSEAFQKCIENGLQLNVKNMKTLLVNPNDQVFSWCFRGIYTNSVEHKKYYNSNNLPRPHIAAFWFGSETSMRNFAIYSNQDTNEDRG